MINFNGINWKSYHGALIPNLAPHCRIDLSDQDAARLLEISGARFLRWHTQFDQTGESPFWHVIKNHPATLNDLGKNTRNQVRKGLKLCNVQRTDSANIARRAYAVYSKAMRNYRGRTNPLSGEAFREGIARLGDEPEYEFWEVCNQEGTLVAYAQTNIQQESCNYQVIKLDPDHLKSYPGYALIHEMNCYYLNERNLLYVNDGARSIRHDTGVQDFLIRKFGFRKAYSRLHIAYNRKVGALVRVLMPFQPMLSHFPRGLGGSLSALLDQEALHRASRDQA